MQHKWAPNLNAPIEPQQLLYTCANEYKYLAQAAVLDFKLLEVMTLEAQKDQKYYPKKKPSTPDCWADLLFLSSLIQRIGPVGCGNVCIKSSSCSSISFISSYVFLKFCLLKKLNLIGFQRINRTKCVQPLTSLPFTLSYKLYPLKLTGFLIQNASTYKAIFSATWNSSGLFCLLFVLM